MFDINDAIKRSDLVEGWMRGEEKKFLYNAALNTPGDGVVVEIGSWKGKSTVLMACALKKLNALIHSDSTVSKHEIFAVDPFGKPDKMDVLPAYDLWTQQGQNEHFRAFLDNVKEQGVEDVVVPIQAMSEDAIEIYKTKYNKPIRVLFIDGCHQREYAQKDFDLWSPLVIQGGIIAFHDAWDRNTDFHDSAAIVAKNELVDSSSFKHGQVQSIIWGRKL
jgi:predicted O-methyltransferase YrrM